VSKIKLSKSNQTKKTNPILKQRNSDNLLLLFVRKPILGKCKTRLAQSIGEEKALEVYQHLLEHTATVVKNVKADKQVLYADEIGENDAWDEAIFEKYKQVGKDLGERMHHAFAQGFERGYKNIIIMGSDLFTISQDEVNAAFQAFQRAEVVIGPAEDGGYYMLGLNEMNEAVFENKNWSTEEVLSQTLADITDKELSLLEEKNDIDTFEDLKKSNFLNQQIHL
jgi:hypothetical protein